MHGADRQQKACARGGCGPERPRGPRGRSRDPSAAAAADRPTENHSGKRFKERLLLAASVRNAPSCGEKEADAAPRRHME